MGGRRALVLAGLVLVALNLRPAFASVSPVLETIRQDLGLSRAATGLLSTIPVLCMGVFASARTGDRMGLERGVLWSVILIGAATAGRLAGDFAPALYATTLLLGFGIGGLFPLALTLPLDYSPDQDAASRLTAMTFGVGYLLAALGPLAMGALRDTTGSYATPFAALVALTAAMLVSIPTLTPANP
jgi:CP family cyanate transporter-like MFS transporter